MQLKKAIVKSYNYFFSNQDIQLNSLLHFHKWYKGAVKREEEEEKTALIIAAERGDVKTVKALLEHSSTDVNAQARFFQLKKEKIKGKKKLIDKKQIEEDTKTETALHIAVQSYNYDIIKVLLQSPNININARLIAHHEVKKVKQRKEKKVHESDETKTALHIAAQQGSAPIVELLLSQPKIDTTEIDESGHKPSEITDNVVIKNLFNLARE